MGIAALTAGAMSFGKSIYDYRNWDRLTVDQKIDKLRDKFSSKSIHHGVLKENDIAAYNPFNESVTLTDKALGRSYGYAKSIVNHELRHRYDDLMTRHLLDKTSPKYDYDKWKMIHDRESKIFDGKYYREYTERNAWSTNISTGNKYHLNYNEWKSFFNGARYYGVPQSAYKINSLPMIIRNIF